MAIGADESVTFAFVDLRSAELRSLDVVHLAAALELGDDLTALITYDQRMADAARGVGLRVVAPA